MGVVTSGTGSIEEEFEGADLGDQRLNRRLLEIGKRLAADPKKSFPKALSTESELEAGYRFFGNCRVKPEEILRPHVENTARRVAGEGVGLLIHDSSTLSFGSEGFRKDLTESSGGRQRFIVHASLALSADGSRRPLGILHTSHHVLSEKSAGPRSEGYRTRWVDHIEATEELLDGRASVVHLMDREADSYEILLKLSELGSRFVVRAKYDRKSGASGQTLQEELRSATFQAVRTVPLGRRGAIQNGAKQRKVHPPRLERDAKLTIRSREFCLQRSSGASKNLAESIQLWVLHVVEEHPPEGESGVEWILHTSEAINSEADALRVVDWYRARWTIEEYFKALKSGCAFEKRQLESRHALENALAVFLPIAWRLLAIRHAARQSPDQPASDIFSPFELRVLRWMVLPRRKKFPEHPSVRDAYLGIAALGGHIRFNGEPGWATIALGMDDFLRALAVAKAAQNGFHL